MRSPHKALPPSLRFAINRVLIDSPMLAPTFMRSRGSLRPLMVGAGSDIVVEGFPRSANSFAFYAVKLTLQDRAVVAGHTHSSQTVVAAVERGIPTVLALRNPRDVVSSLVQFVEGLSPAAGLRAYSRFHERVLPVAGGVVVASFETLVNDLDEVMREVNRRYRTDFEIFRNDEASKAAVTSVLVEMNHRYNDGRTATLASPTDARSRTADGFGMSDQATTRAMARADEVFQALWQEAI